MLAGLHGCSVYLCRAARAACARDSSNQFYRLLPRAARSPREKESRDEPRRAARAGRQVQDLESSTLQVPAFTAMYNVHVLPIYAHCSARLNCLLFRGRHTHTRTHTPVWVEYGVGQFGSTCEGEFAWRRGLAKNFKYSRGSWVWVCARDGETSFGRRSVGLWSMYWTQNEIIQCSFVSLFPNFSRCCLNANWRRNVWTDWIELDFRGKMLQSCCIVHKTRVYYVVYD